MTRTEAISLIKSAQLMLINPTTNEPVSDLHMALEMAISALEQEPCDDAISREAVCDYIAEFVNNEYSTQAECEMVDFMIEGIQHLPSVTQKCEKCAMNGSGSKYCDNCGQKSGKWIWSDEIDRYVCDKCGQSDGKDKEMVESGEYPLSNYCPNCGARMAESEDKR